MFARLLPVVWHQQQRCASSKVALLALGNVPRLELLTLDTNVGDFAAAVDNGLAAMGKMPFPLKEFRAIKTLPDSSVVYGGLQVQRLSCSDVGKTIKNKVKDVKALLPTWYTATADRKKEMTNNIKRQDVMDSLASGTGEMFFSPSFEKLFKDVENNDQFYFLERQRTRAMISHLRRKESIGRIVHECNSNIDHFWCSFRGKGGDILFAAPDGLQTSCSTDENVLVENKLECPIELHMMQTDADCLVQLSAQLAHQINTSKSISELPRRLSCYGVGFSAKFLLTFLRVCEIDFDAHEAKSCLLFVAPLSTHVIDQITKFALGEIKD